MDNLRARILQQLLNHLEESDSEDLRPKPKVLEEVSIGLAPKHGEETDATDEMDDAKADASDKGPMEELVASKDGKSPGASAKDDDDELSDDELEELVREHLK